MHHLIHSNQALSFELQKGVKLETGKATSAQRHKNRKLGAAVLCGCCGVKLALQMIAHKQQGCKSKD